MEGDNNGMRYFVTEVFRLMRSRHAIFNDIPIESIPPAEEVSQPMIENMSKVVFMHSFSSRAIWQPYLSKNFDRFTVSWKLYLQYIIYTYYCMNNGIYEVNERLVSILSVAATIESFLCNRGHKEFLRDAVDVVCKFLEREVAKNFFLGGGWPSLNEYLLGHGYLAMFEEKYKPMSQADVNSANNKLLGLLSKFLKNFVPGGIEQEDIENHEPTKAMVSFLLQRP